jgi:hypothetical protein
MAILRIFAYISRGLYEVFNSITYGLGRGITTASPSRELGRVPAEASLVLSLALVLTLGVDDSPRFREVIQIAPDP